MKIQFNNLRSLTSIYRFLVNVAIILLVLSITTIENHHTRPFIKYGVKQIYYDNFLEHESVQVITRIQIEKWSANIRMSKII